MMILQNPKSMRPFQTGTSEIYNEARHLAQQLRIARHEVVALTGRLGVVERSLRLSQAQVERGLVKQAGGEKQIGSTAEDRERVYTLALNADPNHQNLLKARDEAALALAGAQAEVAALGDEQKVLLAALYACRELTRN